MFAFFQTDLERLVRLYKSSGFKAKEAISKAELQLEKERSGEFICSFLQFFKIEIYLNVDRIQLENIKLEQLKLLDK
jgi:hypothetical protein